MKIFALARSTAMRLRDSSASILSCAAAAVAASADAVAAAIFARRAVSSSGSILRNIALVVTFLTLVVEVLLFWNCKSSGGVLFLLRFCNLVVTCLRFFL